MKKYKETLGSVAFMCGFALLSVTASCQDLVTGTTTTAFPKIAVIAQAGGRIEKYIKINDAAKKIVVHLNLY